VAIEFDTQEQLDAYLEEHPDADKSLHSVKPKKDHAPPPADTPVPDPPGGSEDEDLDLDDEDEDLDDEDDDAKSRKKVKVPASKAPDPDMEDFTEDDDGPVGDLVRKVKKKESPTVGEVLTALRLVRKAMKGDVSPDDLKMMKKVNAWVKSLLGEEEEEEVLKVGPSKYGPIEMSDLSKSQADKLSEFAKANKDKKKKSPAELKKDFLDHVKNPDDRKAFEEMDDDDFMAMLKTLWKKKGSLRSRTVRLAYVRPDLRPHLLGVL
jgi:hypothetical protein